MRHYILNEKKEAVLSDLMTWAKSFERIDRKVAHTKLKKVFISTGRFKRLTKLIEALAWKPWPNEFQKTCPVGHSHTKGLAMCPHCFFEPEGKTE